MGLCLGDRLKEGKIKEAESDKYCSNDFPKD